ncbi:ThiF family adenylyltransferase [Cryobacterium sp. Y57]|uniref:HesA/MoeB/ThiF family protein n=1 Tax=Cryobacterium sp. Y57 TaxID=2048287 RepID=UPI001304F302|nr:ThiF family adenylyltransferase [Cryobacterium sp. Y57]
MRVEISCPYPAHPPRVFIEDDKPLSWHQNADGSLCLYSQTSPGAFPWFAHGALLDQIRGWLEKDAAGWVGDFPDLDLERYWTPNTRFTLLVHDELPEDGNYWLRFDRVRPSTLVQSGSSWPPRRRPKSHKHLYGWSVDIGEVATPPRSWVELSADLKDSADIEGALRERRADVLLLRYTRDGQRGVLGLVPVPGGSSQELQFRSVSCASRSPETMALRAGFQSSQLREKSVTIVGVGAIGSFIAEGLFRSGMGRLLLVDGDQLRPGNLVRHAASVSLVGKPKAEAMAETLGASAIALAARVDSLASAMQLVESSDLVIDATANEVVTQLLAEAGRVSGKSILSVYLANQGRSKVIEVLPCAIEARFIPQEMAPAASDGVESGCGDPVSATPPFAVMEVAAMACRIATAMLVDDAGNANSECREQQ